MVGGEFGMVGGYCPLITMVTCMHFLDLTVPFWALVLLYVLLSFLEWPSVPVFPSPSQRYIYIFFNLTFKILYKHCLPFLEPSSMTFPPMQN